MTRAAPASSTRARSADRLRASRQWCRELTRARARNFYYGLRLTPEPGRSALYALYAWMRLADDAADDARPTPAERRARVERLAALTDELFAGARLGPGGGRDEAGRVGLEASPMWPAFADAVARYDLPARHFDEMIAGLLEDLERDDADASADAPEPRPVFAAWAETERYCYRVASTVGQLCVRVWGVRSGVDPDRADDLAVRRGLAFQLTNILRDVGRDYDDGRVYLPEELFAAHGVTPAALRAWADDAACRGLVRGAVERARGHYSASAELESLIEPSSAPAMWAMTRIYSGLLERVARSPHATVGADPAKLPRLQKLAIGLGAVARATRSPSAPAANETGRGGA